MFQDSPYAHPVGSFQFPVPIVDVDPGTGTPAVITVDCEWIPYIIGALKQLLLQSTWRTEDPEVLALQQQRVFNLIDLFQCAGAAGDMFDVRQNPFISCILEKTIDGGLSWTPFADLSTCFNALSNGIYNPPVNGQPGNPQPIIDTGFCTQFGLTVEANSFTLIPLSLIEGDTLSVKDGVMNGAWTDIAIFPVDWFCGDGTTFISGCNPGTGGTLGTDPLPTANHMRLILVDPDGAYHDFGSGPFTVPAGITDGYWTFQANDDPISDNNGNVTFTLEICRDATTITYTAGSGPDHASFGAVIEIRSTVNPFGHDDIAIVFSRDIRFTVLETFGWNNVTSDGTHFAQSFDASDTPLDYLVKPANTQLTEWPSGNVLRKFEASPGAGGEYTLTCMINAV